MAEHVTENLGNNKGQIIELKLTQLFLISFKKINLFKNNRPFAHIP